MWSHRPFWQIGNRNIASYQLFHSGIGTRLVAREFKLMRRMKCFVGLESPGSNVGSILVAG
jgi:hypothetical protein